MTDVHTWLTRHAADSFAYLTTTGRKSGRSHRIEIWFGISEDRIFMMAGGRDQSDWVKNLIADPHVAVELGGETRIGNAQVVSPDDADDAVARDLLFNKYRKDDNLDDWRVRALPVVITFPASDE